MSEGERIRPRKWLGQHFLRDKRVIERIVEAVDPQPGDFILEYGCGTGVLTYPLVESGACLMGFEVDRDLLARLRSDPALAEAVFSGEGLEDWPPARVAERVERERIKVAANLPYQLTSTALFDIADGAHRVERAVFMMQREVAQRVAASPGGRDFGLLPALIQARHRVEKVGDAAPGAFHPPPRVHSRVLKFTPLAEPRVAPELWDAYKSLLKAVFAERRKQLKSTLRKFYEVDMDFLIELSEAAGVDLSRRPETLSVEELARLAEGLPECRR
jgi:16S rRNA (adenine1518-N6/adenine1519-N6)-dimethyltransferase